MSIMHKYMLRVEGESGINFQRKYYYDSDQLHGAIHDVMILRTEHGFTEKIETPTNLEELKDVLNNHCDYVHLYEKIAG